MLAMVHRSQFEVCLSLKTFEKVLNTWVATSLLTDKAINCLFYGACALL